MKKRNLDIHIHLTNRWLYTLIAILILVVIGVGVYAANYVNPTTKTGHDLSELQPCNANQFLKMNAAGTAWTCADMSTAVVETDPTVKSWAKTDNPSISNSLTTGGNITTLGVINIAKQYKYTSSMWTSGHTNIPRCPCDTSTNGRECNGIIYTNIDSGATCYDYWYATSGYALGPGNVQTPWTRTTGPFITNTYS